MILYQHSCRNKSFLRSKEELSWNAHFHSCAYRKRKAASCVESKRTSGKLQIVLASYDSKELCVQRNSLQEENDEVECTCFQTGSKLLQALRADPHYDLVVLCSQLADMDRLSFLQQFNELETRPGLFLFEECQRTNDSALRQLLPEGCHLVPRMDLRKLLRTAYQLPGQHSRQIHQQCADLYTCWKLCPAEIGCGYLTSAVCVAFSTSRKLAVRKEILQLVSEQYNVSVSAVDSSIRRLIDQLDLSGEAAWDTFKKEHGFGQEKPTTGKLIYALKQHLLWHDSLF